MVCKFLKWNHLPVDGGLYAQDPKFLDDIVVLGNIENEAEKRKQALEKRKAKNPR